MTLKQIRNNVLNFMDNVCVFRVQGVVHCGHFYQADCCLVQAIARRMYMASGETDLALLLMVQEVWCQGRVLLARQQHIPCQMPQKRWLNAGPTSATLAHRLSTVFCSMVAVARVGHLVTFCFTRREYETFTPGYCPSGRPATKPF